MNHLAREALDEKVKSILFLTPCHATPYYSMLHYNLPMQFLDCSPRFGIYGSGGFIVAIPKLAHFFFLVFEMLLCLIVKREESQMNLTVF